MTHNINFTPLSHYLISSISIKFKLVGVAQYFLVFFQSNVTHDGTKMWCWSKTWTLIWQDDEGVLQSFVVCKNDVWWGLSWKVWERERDPINEMGELYMICPLSQGRKVRRVLSCPSLHPFLIGSLFICFQLYIYFVGSL